MSATTYTTTIDPQNLGTVDKRVAKANKRLTRLGMENLYELLVGETTVRTDEDGTLHIAQKVTLVYPEYTALAGWHLLASLTPEEGGFVIRTAPGETAEGVELESPSETRCDHCGTLRRNRRKFYLLRHDDGSTVVVGSTCIQDFLGVNAPWLATIEDDAVSTVFGGGPSYGEMAFPTRHVLALALAASANGENYQSAYSGATSTAQIVSDVLLPPTGVDASYRSMLANVADRATEVSSDDIERVFEEASAADEYSDWVRNIRTILASEHVTMRSLNLAVSAVCLIRSANRAQAKAAKVWKDEYLGLEGDVLVDMDATVERIVYSSNAWGTLTIITFDIDGHQAVWFASAEFDHEVGDNVVIARARIKGCDTFNDVKQTVLTRARCVSSEKVAA